MLEALIAALERCSPGQNASAEVSSTSWLQGYLVVELPQKAGPPLSLGGEWLTLRARSGSPERAGSRGTWRRPEDSAVLRCRSDSSIILVGLSGSADLP